MWHYQSDYISTSYFLMDLYEDTFLLWLKRKNINKHNEDLTSFEFLKKYVSLNIPCIIRSKEFAQWKIFSKFNNFEELKDLLTHTSANKKIKVNLTPNGLADSIITHNSNKLFLKPAETQMTLPTFFDLLNNTSPSSKIAYLSQQDDNLRKEFKFLLLNDLIKPSFGISDAFNSLEATNFWIGDSRSTSSLHKDYYENLYCVLEGTKIFYLIPPTGVRILNKYKKKVPVGEYVWNDEENFEVVEKENEELEWFDSIDFEEEEVRKWTIKVEVKKGEILYLPALWYHQVTQTEPTAAVNFWYDMNMDQKYLLSEVLESLQ
eukprot:maker-scaffold_13-snap-gene-11.4-mRNA-1 protein AED:0.16 eAED:0.22 QI:0/0/0/1/1/1/2/0/318